MSSVLPEHWPAHWEARPAWNVLVSREEYGGNGEHLSLSVAHGVRIRDAAEGRAASDTTDHYRVVRRDDLVINRLVARDGAIAVSPISGLISPAYWVMTPRRLDDDVRFIAYQLRSSVYLAELARVSKNMPPAQFDLPWDQFKKIPVVLPPPAEQRSIADFLDGEVAHIDALIAKKRRLLDLIVERFRSAIERFLRTGAWPRPSLSQLLARRVADGPHETPDFINQGVPFLSVDAFVDDRLNFEGCRHVSYEAHRKYSLKAKPQRGDVLMTKAAAVGRVALVETSREFNVWSPVAILRPNPAVLRADYLAHVLRSQDLQTQIQLASTSNTQQNLAMGDIASLRVPLPPLDEQERVAAASDRYLTHQREFRGRMDEQIERLYEHRQALITAAVTGELAVPGVVRDSG